MSVTQHATQDCPICHEPVQDVIQEMRGGRYTFTDICVDGSTVFVHGNVENHRFDSGGEK